MGNLHKPISILKHQYFSFPNHYHLLVYIYINMAAESAAFRAALGRLRFINTQQDAINAQGLMNMQS